MHPVLYNIILVMNYVIFIYFITLNLWYFSLNFIAYRGLKRYSSRMRVVEPDDSLLMKSFPALTFLVPAFNESDTCAESVESLLKMKYPGISVIFINDGSSDDTLERMITYFEMEESFLPKTADIKTQPVKTIYRSTTRRNLWLIDKVNGKKADALNVGINHAQTPLIANIDSDSMLEHDAIARVAVPFMEDDRTIVSGGIIRMSNGCEFKNGSVKKVDLPKNIWAQFQIVEYLRAFLSGRVAWDMLDASLIVSGAFGVFKRSAVVEVGGYLHETIGEDMELIVRLHHHFCDKGQDYKIRFVPDPVAWTKGPEKRKTLAKQRDRWHRGLIDSLRIHKKMLFRKKYNNVGKLAMPFFFFYEMIGPLIELSGYIIFALLIITGFASSTYVVAFFLVAIILGVSLSIFSLVLEEISFHRYPKLRHLFQLMWLSFLENFGYRQMNTLWRIRGTYSYMTKNKDWY